jgi:hypothetical protein
MKLTLKIVVLDEDYWLLLAMSVEVLANNETESSVHCGNVTNLGHRCLCSGLSRSLGSLLYTYLQPVSGGVMKPVGSNYSSHSWRFQLDTWDLLTHHDLWWLPILNGNVSFKWMLWSIFSAIRSIVN